MSADYAHAANLQNIRRNIPTSPIAAAKSVAGAVSLTRYINPFMDWLFGIALALALLKDILDFVGIGSLPAIGTVVTIIVSLSIGFIMLLTGSLATARWVRRVGILLFGSLVEIVFGLNFLPVETTIVIIVFYMTLKSRAEEARKLALRSSQ
jgi:hypothetical protein